MQFQTKKTWNSASQSLSQQTQLLWYFCLTCVDMASSGWNTNERLFHHQILSTCFPPRKISGESKSLKVVQWIYFHGSPEQIFIFEMSKEKFIFFPLQNKIFVCFPFRGKLLPCPTINKNLCLVRIPVSWSKLCNLQGICICIFALLRLKLPFSGLFHHVISTMSHLITGL